VMNVLVAVQSMKYLSMTNNSRTLANEQPWFQLESGCFFYSILNGSKNLTGGSLLYDLLCISDSSYAILFS
jgi:hypothetical protein